MIDHLPALQGSLQRVRDLYPLSRLEEERQQCNAEQ